MTHVNNEERAKVGRFITLWNLQHHTASNTQKDAVGKTFMIHILGLSESVIKKFLEGDADAYHKVGSRMAVVGPFVNLSDFWDGVQRIFPDTYTSENIKFLSQKGRVGAVFQFLYSLDPPGRETSKLLRELTATAHVYK